MNIPQEIWLPIADYPEYKVSNLGHVKKGEVLIKVRTRNYVKVGPRKGGVKMSINRLVAKYFVPNDDPIKKTILTSIDGNNRNSKASNLRWDMRKRQVLPTKSRGSDKPILQYDLKMKFVKEWSSIKAIIADINHNYHASAIYDSINNVKSVYGYIWKYKTYVKKKITLEADETFKTIGQFKDNIFSNYEVSNYGKVRHIKTKKYTKLAISVNYPIIKLIDDSRASNQVLIHKLVAYLFVPNTEKHNAIQHIDGNIKNNYYKNLKWITVTHIKPKKVSIKQIFTDIELGTELWLNVKNFNHYQVSSLGRVRTKKSGKYLKPNLLSKYYTVDLYDKEGKNKFNFRIHRLVAQVFNYNPDPRIKIIVDHIDNNRLNNRFTNLRWVTQKENMEYYHQNHKPEYIRPVIQYDFNMFVIKEYKNIHEIVEQNPFYKYKTLAATLKGDHKTAYTYTWKYRDIKEEKEIVLQTDEELKSVGIINNNNFDKYKISNYGKIYSNHKNAYLSPNIYANGYEFINMINSTSGKIVPMTIHSIVAYVFINRNPPKDFIVNHLDENKLNNQSNNLEWISIPDNINYSIKRQQMIF